MIRIIAVDDEKPALRRVTRLLELIPQVQTVGLFHSSTDCLNYILTEPERIDLALLDMEMPMINGLELARRLRECRPEIHIAFLTAYEGYAKSAFEVEAIDFLLKPILQNDLERTIGRLVKRNSSKNEATHQSKRGIAVQRFGPFNVLAESGDMIRFRNSKSKELLAYLHHHQGKAVSKAQIMDEIWYGKDEQRTQTNLYSTIYQLRKDLEVSGISDLISQTKTAGGSYSLNWRVSFDDVDSYEEEVRLFKQNSSLTHALKAVQLYGEGYLSGSGYAWATTRQAELELGYAELLEAIVKVYVRQQRFDIALNLMRKWAELNPLSSLLHVKIISLLLLMKREDDARSYYEIVRDLLDQDEESSRFDFKRLCSEPSRQFI
ncbi:response regulator [Paenibacillus sp. AD87]|uniref:response regulator n=1 Tax=Paenibacillus sp. AD87 TaxID=1528787 RepID=UPI0007E4C722|nr:response regulator [Paenibacillus sp. AD87]OAX49889.1 Transcriptional regulatory protein YehT [Paenibacillus sp. AD87]